MSDSAQNDDSRLRSRSARRADRGRPATGQELLVHGELEHAPLLRAIAGQAYEAGAPTSTSSTAIRWCAGRRSTSRRRTGSAGRRRGWSTRMEQRRRGGLRRDHVAGGSNAEVYEGADPARMAAARIPEFEKRVADAVTGAKVAWTIRRLPDRARGRPRSSASPTSTRLWEAVAHVDAPRRARPGSRLERAARRARRARAGAHRARFDAHPLPRARAPSSRSA